ncbi:putative adhesin [Nonomuraea muscovyensis]|uniref:putative adhesin n=1 Tax=Nonomuraea muscovyensis TaxID=1124761 RepID=UPI0033DB3E2A
MFITLASVNALFWIIYRPWRYVTKPIKRRITRADPVDVASGEVVLTQTDVELPGFVPLVLGRTHVSSYRGGGWFGRSWASTVDQRLVVGEGEVLYASADGMVLLYPLPAAGSTTMSEEGPRMPLARAGDAFTITDPESGHLLHFAPRPGYEGAGAGARTLPLIAVTDRNGHRIDIDHRDDGSPARIRSSSGHRIAVDCEQGRVRVLRLVSGLNAEAVDHVLVRYGYDEEGRLSEVTNSSGLPLRFSYDPEGRLTGWADRDGCWYRYRYDADGRCVRTEGSGDCLNAAFAYADSRTVMTDSLGHITTFDLNDRGQVVTVTDPLGHSVHREWDGRDRLRAATDPLGRSVRHAYDERGNLTAITRPDGRRAEVTHNALDLPTVITEADGSVWRQEYDHRGNLVARIDALGAVTRYGYDERGGLVHVTDALGNVTRVTVNDAGLPTVVTDPAGAVTRYTYDEFGRLSAVTDPVGGVTRYGWTIEGKLSWQTSPGGATERWSHDPEGNVTSHVDAQGRVTRTEYTHFELVSALVAADGARLEFSYDSELRLTSVTDPKGQVWRYEYDAAGRLTREIDFNGRELTYTLDAAGRVTARANGAGQTIRYTYDVLDNVVRRAGDDGADTVFAYDLMGRLVHAGNAEADLVLHRDALGQVLTEICNGRALHARYDSLGRRTWRRTPSGAETTWHYGRTHQPVALHLGPLELRWRHDGAGRETSQAIGHGATLTRHWDADHRLGAQTLWGAVPAAPGAQQTGAAPRRLHRTYAYRSDGLLVGIHDERTGSQTFELDDAGRITVLRARRGTERYSYDTAGNLTQATWPGAGEGTAEAELIGAREYSGTLLRRAGRAVFDHDGQGRVVRRQDGTSGQVREWRYAWDADDRLVEVITPEGRCWRYVYDPLGRRIAKQRLADDGRAVAERIDFAWDDVVLAEQTRTVWRGTGTERRTTSWEYEPGSFRPLAQADRHESRDASQGWADQRLYAIITDTAGTPTDMVDPTGEIVWRREDSSLWGVATGTRDDGVDCPLRFANQYHDPETGLHYNYHRYYDPATARYLSGDPLGLEGSPNPYAYVGNPFHTIDPLGLLPCAAPRPDGQLVLSGHGSYKKKNGDTTVPRGTTICFYAPHGASITDRLGNAIETGRPGVKPVTTYLAGDQVPNYTLHWPGELEIKGTPQTVFFSKTLSELLQPNMGRVHWAACQYEKGHPNAGRKHMVDL